MVDISVLLLQIQELAIKSYARNLQIQKVSSNSWVVFFNDNSYTSTPGNFFFQGESQLIQTKIRRYSLTFPDILLQFIKPFMEIVLCCPFWTSSLLQKLRGGAEYSCLFYIATFHLVKFWQKQKTASNGFTSWIFSFCTLLFPWVPCSIGSQWLTYI